ncbi:MAG: ATP-dependent helicase [Candidatus Andersenbacteria bacterium]|nr:ATP-dependent helicase [Candidatus Andersenbacteria bacterium]MBI3250944.1 ATP-dependent helicase [Candidatus Andersenbacteria bacterium]
MATKTTSAFEEAYSRLNKGQKKAVDTIDGPVMVLAGPGTGKTQTLTVRIGNILQKTQLDPWNILCLTFTESAAAEMRERLADMIGSSAYHVRISTFHSFCNQVIQDHPEIFALSSDWKPLAEVERVKLMQDILDNLPGTSSLKPFTAPYLYLKDCVQHIQALKQEDISPKDFSEVVKKLAAFAKEVGEEVKTFSEKKPTDRTDKDCESVLARVLAAAKKHKLPAVFDEQLKDVESNFITMGEAAEDKRTAGKARTKCKNDLKRVFTRIENNVPRWRELKKVYEQYQEALQKNGRYDFEDMIILVVQEFRRNKDLLADYQEQFQYILVDEFQDTNGAQNEVVDFLGSFDETPNIFVVGDDKQSIYRFQGASLANMLAFYEKYKEHAAVITLSENYRSQKIVLDAAAAVISRSKYSLAKLIPGVSIDLIPQAKITPKPITQYIVESSEQEVAVLADEISTLLKKGVSPKEIAVLVRYNRDAADIAPALRKFNIRASLAAGENALAQTAVIQWLSIWRYLLSPSGNDYLLADIIRFSWWDISALDSLRAIHAAGRQRRTLTTTFTDKQLLIEAGVENPAKIIQLIELLASWEKLAANTTISNLVTTMLEESGWLQHIQDDATGLAALQHMSRVLEQTKEIAGGDHSFSLKDFVELIDLHIRHDVPLMTPQRRLGKDSVTVMTAHKAKGLEFEYVFLPRFIDKSWGGGRTPYRLPLPDGLVKGDLVAEGEAEEDERRLLYVALTRAKKNITISRARVNAAEKPVAPSLFLHELPEETLKTIEKQEKSEDAGKRLVEGELSSSPPASSSDLKDWVRQILDGYVMSVTHLNHYLEDPHLFYTRHILRIPSVRSFYQAMGTAVHNALDDFFRRFSESGKLPPRSFLLERFKRHLQREALTKQEFEDVLAVGNEQLGGYYDFYKTGFVSKTLGEYDFRSHNVRVDGVPITGKIDKIELINDKEVNVVDYKTGAPEKAAVRLKPGGDYHRQIVFYKLLAEQSPEFKYDVISGEVDFIRPTKSGKFVKKKIEVTGKDLEELAQTLKRVWQEIQELKFLD